MQSLPEVIYRTINEGINAYQKALETADGVRHKTIFLDCAHLPEPINWSEKALFDQELWKELEDTDKQPCLYYFEMIEQDVNVVLKAFTDFKQNQEFSHRATPALKKHIPFDTQILYVGKVKQHFAGRLWQHMGRYHVGATAGLQLRGWAREIGLKLRVHIFAFPPEMYQFVDPLELPFARALRPLIGKH